MKLAVALPFAEPLRSFAVASPLGKSVFVATGADATGTELVGRTQARILGVCRYHYEQK